MNTRAEMKARELLRCYAIEDVSDIAVRDIAYARGLLVQERPIRGAEGRLLRGPRKGIATVDDAIAQPGKKRFVIAHELGHFELHRDDDIFVCDEAAFLDWHRNRPQETEANVFAAELLMPSRLFQQDARGRLTSFDTLKVLAENYRVTLTAAAFRYATLDIVPCTIVFSQNGTIVWYLCSDSFPYRYIRRGNLVHPHSGAGELFAQGSTSPDPELTPYEAWFIDDDLVPGEMCYEQCLPMPRYEAALSLIWQA
jgi:hypothetical protein